MATRRPVFVEDVIGVLLEKFDYEFEYVSPHGVTFIKDIARGHVLPLYVPLGAERLSHETLDYLFQKADFSMTEFYAKLAEYIRPRDKPKK